MIRNLSQRLKRLEARAIPAGEPMVIEVQFVSAEKVVTGSLLVEIGPGLLAPPRAAKPGSFH
jgi:hypothetical protein